MASRREFEPGGVATRNRIVESAKRRFLEYGYQAAPLRKIAADAGFTSGALYGYFESKEQLFYAVTDPIAEKVMEKLDDIRAEMDAQPEQKRFSLMGSIYYPHIPAIVDLLLSDRDAVTLIVNSSQGTKYENFLDNIANRNAAAINMAAENAGEAHSIERQTMNILMEGYIATLFRLVTSDRDRETIIECMEAIGRVYETGVAALMQKEE